MNIPTRKGKYSCICSELSFKRKEGMPLLNMLATNWDERSNIYLIYNKDKVEVEMLFRLNNNNEILRDGVAQWVARLTRNLA